MSDAAKNARSLLERDLAKADGRVEATAEALRAASSLAESARSAYEAALSVKADLRDRLGELIKAEREEELGATERPPQDEDGNPRCIVCRGSGWDYASSGLLGPRRCACVDRY